MPSSSKVPHDRFHGSYFGSKTGLDNAVITFNVTARNSNQHNGIYYNSMKGSVSVQLRLLSTADDRQHGTVVFRLRIMSVIRFKISTWKSVHHEMHVNCDVAVGSDGLILLAWKNRKCSVYFS
ncbi:uncharacterized protein LOC108451351 [Gossypium arboreum]|uniref:Late embryogenesis abundant protein LEA-2 subgroup domain-containing protein n=1 Tax=Gossypium hirsutum TaxID=3635 RepID=A0ABM2YXS9_GOSHI|nr:uncharacterized protein LOC107925042 [Gossypium hirsutum]XP_052875866.1 uncharacterized protein LOC108451351 [Gossypium arboreum]